MFADSRASAGAPTRLYDLAGPQPFRVIEASPGPLGCDRPLAFLHIAKTGGTSLTRALASLYPSQDVFSDDGNVSAAYVESLGDRLCGRVFLAGHFGPGAAQTLTGRADMITLLRQPGDQAVSNYLHVLSDPANSLHETAMRGSFSDFMRRNPYAIDYQTRSLCVAIASDPPRMDALRLRNFDGLLSFLRGLGFVGVIERAEACGAVLSRLLGIDDAITLDHHNAAFCRGISARTLDRLRREYDTLRADPALAPGLEREARVYAEAEAVLARLEQRTAPARTARAAPGLVSAPRFSTHSGGRHGDTLVADLRDGPAHLVFGPHVRLEPGAHAVTFDFTAPGAAPGTGRIEIEVLSNGAASLRRRWLRRGAWAEPHARTLEFLNADASNILEFRVRAAGFAAGTLVFGGVTIRPCETWRAVPSWSTRLVSALRRRLGRPAAPA